MMERKKIAVIGCLGKMGQVLCRYLISHPDFELSAGIDVAKTGEDLGLALGLEENGIRISPDIRQSLASGKIDIAVDFTTPATVVENAKICLAEKIPVLIGTTGISRENEIMLDSLAREKETSVMIVPNFAIGAILMMEFAKKAAKYMKNVEIIEFHHQQKLDKPSGTALKTRRGILNEMGIDDENSPEVPVHSVRLPGLVAHQSVIFGDIGQTLTIRHDSLNRDSFMPGIALALKQIQSFRGLRIGLEV